LFESNGPAELQRLRKTFNVLEGLPGVSDTWENLVGKHLVLGKQAHDANLVAIMLVYGVNQILTFNGADFKRLIRWKSSNRQR